MSAAAKAVFLSYASQDADAARKIADTLRAAGVEVWFDQSELRGGDAWDQKIRRQIKECALFVPIISAHTQARREGYFRLEWNLAEDRTRLMAKGTPFLVPVCIDGTSERQALVPDAFAAVQWVRLGNRAIPELVAQVKRLLDEAEERASGSENRDAAEPIAAGERGIAVANPRGTRRKWIGVVGLVALAAIASLAGWRFRAGRVPRITSIAVKPLDDFSGGRGQAYLSDGVTESLCAALGSISSLRVPGRTSVMRYKGSQKTIQEIARELNVDAIVEGSVQLAGQRMLITVQLVEAATDRHLWATNYERDLADFFNVQREVARAVASEISARITPQEQRRLDPGSAFNAEAVTAYLKGVHFASQWTTESTTAAIEQLEKAVRLEPNFAAAHAAMANTCVTAAFLTMRPIDALRKAEAAAQHAVRVDGNSADAFAALAAAKLHLRDWPGTEDALRRALTLNPRHAMAHDWKAWYLAARGRTEEAVVYMRQALEMEPQSVLFNPDMAFMLLYARRHAESAAQSEEAVRLDRSSFQGHETLGWARILRGDHQAGIKTLLAAQQLDNSWSVRAQLTRAYAWAGNRAEAERRLSELLKAREAGEKSLSADILAQVYAALGDNAKALDCLERAVEEYGPRAIWLLVDWDLVKLRDESRYALVVRKLGLDR